MIVPISALLAASLLGADPADVLVASARGELTVPVATERGFPALAAPVLARALPLAHAVEPTTATAVVRLAGQPFQFPLGAPAFRFDSRVYPLVWGAYVARDTLFLPLQWLAEYVPRLLVDRYRYDPVAARLDDLGRAPAVATGAAIGARQPSGGAARTAGPRAAVADDVPEAARRLGLRARHTVAIDPGHGGRDPGNPGRYFPRGVREKDVNLAIALRLKAELERRGIGVIMTRESDVFVPLADRGPKCRGPCDLFVSIHVNSMPPGRRQAIPNGVETYFLAEAKTEEARRVAEMENDAIRFETGGTLPAGSDPLGFILRDLQLNEHLRESADLAAIVQQRLGPVHPGSNRGVAQGPYYVLTNARRPAILIETGFATHPGDARFLASSSGQVTLAKAIADAIVDYLLQYERKVALRDER